MKLRDLKPETYQRYLAIIRDAYQNGYTGGETQDLIKKELKVDIGLRTVYRSIEREKKEWKPVAKPKKPTAAGTCEVGGTGSDTAAIDYVTDKRIRTLDEAIAKSGADMSKWDVGKWKIKSYEQGAKGPDGRIVVTPLWGVHVELHAKKGWNLSEFRQILKDDLRQLAPSYADFPQLENTDGDLLGELSIFDAHFGKLGWRPETGQDYDLDICERRYMRAGRDLISRLIAQGISRLLYVVGNDFFQVDHRGSTTSGTPVDVDGRWQKAFRLGHKCCTALIEEACRYIPVDVMVVQGNHDLEKAFCLGEVLDARFHNNHYVTVDNDPDVYSYYNWGKTLLGFVHGNNHTSDKKRAELPMQMLKDRRKDSANATWMEWHLGHFHSEREDVWKYRSTDHVRDVAVRILPSLSSTDAWHREQGYCSVLAAEAHVYHKQRGRWGYINHQVDPENGE